MIIDQAVLEVLLSVLTTPKTSVLLNKIKIGIVYEMHRFLF